jgi:molybdate transport system substrate-binding protein
MKTSYCALLTLCLLVSSASWAQSDKSNTELTVAAAADLSSVLKDIADGFQTKTGVHARLSFGASGALTQQIENGAPFDLFFSADMDFPRQLIRDGQADGPINTRSASWFYGFRQTRRSTSSIKA